MQRKKNSNSVALWVIIIVVVIGVIWFNNAHPSEHYNGLQDYRDTWFTDTRTVKVLYCGKTPNIYCDTNGNWFLSTVTWHGKESASDSATKWIHYFTIRFPNGGWVETEATCDKAASGFYNYDRFCRAYSYDANGDMSMYLLTPYN